MNGTLLIAGGNIGATKKGEQDIFGRFASLAGGKNGKVLLVVTASGDPADSYQANSEYLKNAGVGETVLLPLTEIPEFIGKDKWTDKADEKLLPLLDGVTGVWFTGGDQLHTVRLLLNSDCSDTPVLAAIRKVLDRGGVIGGSSAGAAVMSRIMIVRGDDAGVVTMPICDNPLEYEDKEESPEQLLLYNGLGFLPWGVVDQHFNRRPRLQRLLVAMDYAGENCAYGISEDTALEVNLSDGKVCVHGSAYVLFASRVADGVNIKKITAAQ